MVSVPRKNHLVRIFYKVLLVERAILRWIQRVVGIRDASVVDQNIHAVKKTTNPAPTMITHWQTWYQKYCKTKLRNFSSPIEGTEYFLICIS
jgi:hypothetical protein